MSKAMCYKIPIFLHLSNDAGDAVWLAPNINSNKHITIKNKCILIKLGYINLTLKYFESFKFTNNRIQLINA